jgi:hypothetical protein
VNLGGGAKVSDGIPKLSFGLRNPHLQFNHYLNLYVKKCPKSGHPTLLGLGSVCFIRSDGLCLGYS